MVKPRRMVKRVMAMIEAVESAGYVVSRVEFDWLHRGDVAAVEFRKKEGEDG